MVEDDEEFAEETDEDEDQDETDEFADEEVDEEADEEEATDSATAAVDTEAEDMLEVTRKKLEKMKAEIDQEYRGLVKEKENLFRLDHLREIPAAVPPGIVVTTGAVPWSGSTTASTTASEK